MIKFTCRIHRGSNSRIYILSDRIDNILDGDYVMDEENKVYLMYLKFFIPTTDHNGSFPIGNYKRIECSNDYRISTKRMTLNFLAACKKHDAQEVVVKLRNNANSLVSTSDGKVVLKLVL